MSKLANASVRVQILVFLALTFGLSTIFYTLILATGDIQAGGGAYLLGLMWCPAAAALIAVELFRIPWSELGWSLPRFRYLAIGYLLPVCYGLVVYGIVWLTGLGRLNPGPLSDGWFLPLTATVGVLQSLVTALGEEIGWRGFLVRRLAKITGFTQTALLSGAIWTLWHLPVILVSNYSGPSGVPFAFRLACFAVLVIGMSFVYTWLRLRSGSLWPAALLHASHNLFILHVFEPLTSNAATTRYFTGEFGILLALTAIALALVFRQLTQRDIRARLASQKEAA